MNNEDIKYLEDVVVLARMLLTTSQKATIQEKEIEAIENLIKGYKELEEEKKLNEKIIYLANNEILGYSQGYKDGLNKETTAVAIVAREQENYIIAKEIKRLKDTIYELHIKLDKGNKKVKQDYIPKSKIREKIKELENSFTYGYVGEEWNDRDVVELLVQMLQEGDK